MSFELGLQIKQSQIIGVNKHKKSLEVLNLSSFKGFNLLFPLNCCRGLGGYVVDDTVDVANLIDYPI